jgi:hypothetical protein
MLPEIIYNLNMLWAGKAHPSRLGDGTRVTKYFQGMGGNFRYFMTANPGQVGGWSDL